MPIELKPGDILKRPDAGSLVKVEGQAGSGFSLKNIKGYIQQVKEIKDAMESLGIDLSAFGIKLPGKKETGAAGGDAQGGGKVVSQAMPPGQQILMIFRLLQGVYGDCTMNDLFSKLKAEFGERKISDFIKGSGL